ncbi:hypothetical protein FA95DRAFT_1493195, partial [Auriscalpium vulgare]
HSVPQEVVNTVADQEKERQEVICEMIYTERDFVRDMECLRDVWLNPLTNLAITPVAPRADFVAQVQDIIAANTRLRDTLNKRQKYNV